MFFTAIMAAAILALAFVQVETFDAMEVTAKTVLAILQAVLLLIAGNGL